MNAQYRKFIQEAVEKDRARQASVAPLIERWKGSRLLEGLSDRDATTLAQLLQNQANQLMTEATRTSTAAGGEEWHDVALPIVRKVFVQGQVKKLIHTQAMDKPSGVFFYLDFTINDNKPSANPFYNANESLYGTTNAVADPSGGFYGSDRFSYSMNYYSASVNAVGSGSATWADVEYNQALSASVSSGNVFKFTISRSALTNLDADMLALASFAFNIPAASGSVTTMLRPYTNDNMTTGLVTFYYVGTLTGTLAGVPVDVRFTQQPKEYDRGDFESGQTGVGLPTELNMKVTNTTVTAKTRWIKSVLTPEAIQDMKAYQTLDAQKEVTNIMSDFLAQEEDIEILNMLSQASRPLTRYWSAQIGKYVNSKTGAQVTTQPTWTQTPNEWYRTLGIKMQDLAFEIQKRTLRGRANWAVVSPKMAAVISSMNLFSSSENKPEVHSVGTVKVGTIENTFTVYSNPYWRENEILMGFKGSNFLETGAAYMTYIPYIMGQPIQSFQDASIHQFLQTRNAKVVVRSEFYGRIVVEDLETF